MRTNLRSARKAAGLTQEQVAEKLEVSLVYYHMIETGRRTGAFTLWDQLEDMFHIHQRVLREMHPAPAGNQGKHPGGQQS